MNEGKVDHNCLQELKLSEPEADSAPPVTDRVNLSILKLGMDLKYFDKRYKLCTF